MYSVPTRRKPAQAPPVGLQIRNHATTGEAYWAVIAVQVMSSGSVGILGAYDESYQKPRKGSVPCKFVDELKPTRPELEDYVVYVDREWLEKFFLEPTWQEFESSSCRLFGVTVGMMTGLLPEDGTPVRPGTRRKKPPVRSTVLADSMKGVLPIVLVNVVILAVVLFLFRWAERQLKDGRSDN